MTQKVDPRPTCPGCGDRMDVCVFYNYYHKYYEAHFKCFNERCDAKWRTAPATGETKGEAMKKALAAALIRRRVST